MPDRYFSNNAADTTLVAGISNSATSIVLASASGLPTSFPFTLALDMGTSNQELVSVTNLVGTTATVTRGIDHTVAVAHSAGAPVSHTHSAQDFSDFQDHQDSDTVHGASGQVVGTGNVQNLRNKTMLADTSSTVACPVKGTPGQTAELLLVTDSASNPFLTVDADGDTTLDGLLFGQAASFTPVSNTDIGVVSIQKTGSSKDLFQGKDDSANVIFAVDTNGSANSISTTGGADRTQEWYAKITLGADQTIPDSAQTTVAFDTEDASSRDTTMVDLANHKIVIPVDGMYAIDAQAYWAPNEDLARDLFIVVNSVKVAGGKYGAPPGFSGAGGTFYKISLALIPLATGDEVTVQVGQNSGADLALDSTAVPGNYLSVGRVAP